MKKMLLSLLVGSCSILLANDTPKTSQRVFDGYNYFAIGVENFRYSERFFYTFNGTYISKDGKTYVKGEEVAVKSKINVNNPVYLSGGLIKLKQKWDLSMDFASTLKPNTTKEEWLDRGDDSVIVENYASIMSNSMSFLLQYKLTNQHRIVGGISYSLNIFKRIDAQSNDLVEETSASAIANFGYWFESNTAALNRWRIKYKITGGIPFYQNVENSKAPDLTFDNAAGFNFDTSLYVGYTLFRGLEIGVFTDYSYMYRDGQTKQVDNRDVIWPNNITQSFKTGLQFSWKFD